MNDSFRKHERALILATRFALQDYTPATMVARVYPLFGVKRCCVLPGGSM
jgi:hypothetical protein